LRSRVLFGRVGNQRARVEDSDVVTGLRLFRAVSEVDGDLLEATDRAVTCELGEVEWYTTAETYELPVGVFHRSVDDPDVRTATLVLGEDDPTAANLSVGGLDVVAVYLARLARGRYAVLFLLCVLLASLTTAVLNLDTTAVLLTPVMVATAQKLDCEVVPFAMTTVWLANTASLLLPASGGGHGRVPLVAVLAPRPPAGWPGSVATAASADGSGAVRHSLVAVVLFMVGVLAGVPLEVAALASAACSSPASR
jgi:hypothetical protein